MPQIMQPMLVRSLLLAKRCADSDGELVEYHFLAFLLDRMIVYAAHHLRRARQCVHWELSFSLQAYAPRHWQSVAGETFGASLKVRMRYHL